MKIPIYKLDAFTNKVFSGNPAAVCVLDSWLDDSILLNIACENNLSETAFIIKDNDEYHIRWFTPSMEVNLCGHATLAAAYVIYNYYNYSQEHIVFNSKSGKLLVRKNDDSYMLNFPKIEAKLDSTILRQLEDCLDCQVLEAYSGMDYVAVVKSVELVQNCTPDFEKINQLKTRGVIITALGDECDFVSRWFGCNCGIEEDPATGSAHCILAPIWAKKLSKNDLASYQLSSRIGEFRCVVDNDRVYLYGQVVPYLVGSIYLNI